MIYINKRRSGGGGTVPILSLLQTYRKDGGAMSQSITGAPNRLAVVVMLNSTAAIPTCALQGVEQANVSFATTTLNYGTAISLVSLPSSGSVTLTTSNLGVGCAGAYVFDTTGITNVRLGTGLVPYANSATSITFPSLTSTGTALNIVLDRDPSAAISSSDSDTILDNFAFTYFKLAVAEKRGTGGTVPGATFFNLVNSYGGVYGSILFE